MKHLYPIFACLVLLSSCAPYAERNVYFSFTPEDSLRKIRDTYTIDKEKTARYDAIYLLSEERIDHAGGRNRWYFQEHHKLRYIVLKPHEEWVSTFKVSTKKHSSLINAMISVISPDGKTHIYNRSDLHFESSSDGSATWKLAYADVQAGSLIEESYIIETEPFKAPPLSHDIRLQPSVPCDKMVLQYNVPSWWNIQFKQIAPDKYMPYEVYEDENTNKLIYTYEANNVTPWEWEPYSPYYKETGNYMEFMITQLNVGPKYSSPYSWKEFSEQYRSDAIDRESFWSGEVRKTAQTITETCSTEVQKLEAVTLYVQQNISVGKSEDEDNFSDLLEKKKGNPYMITGLAKTMLDKLDIPSDLILIHSAQDGYFDSTYISNDQLYIPALYTVIDETPYVIFPYYKNVPIDIIPEPFQGQKALRINESGYNGFMVVPTGKDRDNTTDENYVLTIDDEGKMTVEEEKTFRGFNAYNVREKLQDLKQEELDKTMKEMLTYTEGDVRIISHEVVNQNDIRKPLIIKLKYEVDNLVTVTPDEVLFQTGGLLSPSSSYAKKADTTDRKNPIKVYVSEVINKNITIHHPAQWKVSTSLQDKQFENNFGSVSASYKSEAGLLSIRQQRTLRRISDSRDKYANLLAIIGTRSVLSVPTIVFSVQ